MSESPPGIETSATVRILAPEPGEAKLADQLADLHLLERAHEDRPYLILNFASTLDGRAAIDGRSGAIGSEVDTEVLVRLRTQVDAVMIGAGTMRAERYGRVVGDAGKRAWREQIGLAKDPLMVLVSSGLDLPWDADLFTDGNGSVLIITSSGDQPPKTETPVSVIRHEGAVDLREAMRHLREELGIRSLLCEGGPHLHGELQSKGLADELFLTIAPKLAGGSALQILAGDLPETIELDLVWLLANGSELFGRYRRK